ncbi:MAG: sugar transferase [Phycisphaeraceae bacterium]
MSVIGSPMESSSAGVNGLEAQATNLGTGLEAGLPTVVRPLGREAEAGHVGARLKRALDVLLAATGLLAVLPLMALIALAIKLDSRGPALYRQRRPGRRGEPFMLVKFRTMHIDSAERFRRLDAAQQAEFWRYGKIERDPRVTCVGRVLRTYSLDELPQLWNVLKGEMSLVGPRPYLGEQLRQLGERQSILFRTRPGLTGLWQVSGRSNIPFRRRVAMDVYYVRNWSLGFDLLMLMRTLKVVLTGYGAY